jgi:hypothetical protein
MNRSNHEDNKWSRRHRRCNPEITQINTDSIAPLQGCNAKNAKTIHWKVAVCAFLHLRPSGTLGASQRRTSSVVARKVAGRTETTLLARATASFRA